MNFAMEFLFTRGIPIVLIQQVATGILERYFFTTFPKTYLLSSIAGII